jgi:hypothetical protein
MCGSAWGLANQTFAGLKMMGYEVDGRAATLLHFSSQPEPLFSPHIPFPTT